MHNGKADGTYEDFLTGFVVDDNSVWDNPVGVAIAKHGSMFVTDDASRTAWHNWFCSSVLVEQFQKTPNLSFRELLAIGIQLRQKRR